MADPSDRRAAERFPVSANTTVTFASPVVENFGPVKIKNVSTDGVGLLLSRKVEAGQLLAVSIANPTQKFAKTLMVRVVHVTAQAGGAFLAGGTFTTPLTYEELRSLVF
jgi:PilZ domain-containing protein